MDDELDILQVLKDNKSDVTSCDFGGNYLLAIGSSDKTVRVLEWKIGLGFVDVAYSPLHHHKYGVTWVRFSPQGTMLASSSVDGTTVLWNVKTGIKIHTVVQDSKCSIRRCEFTPDSTKLITAGDNGVFCFWNLVHRTIITKFHLHNEESGVQGLSISPDSEYLLTGDSSGLMRLWCLSDIGLNHLYPALTSKNIHDGINSCDFSSNFEIVDIGTFSYKYLFATCGADGLIKIWNLIVARKPNSSSENINYNIHILQTLVGHENDVLSIHFNLNGSLIASSGLDKTVRLWQVNDGKCLREFVGHSRFVNCCAFSKSSTLLASGSNDKTVIIWNLTHSLSLDSELIKRCSTGSHFSGNGSVRLLSEELVINQSENNVNRLELLQILNLPSGVNTIHFYRNNILATAGGDKNISIWRWKPEESKFVLDSTYEGHTYSVNQVEISPCGTKLISCSMNGAMIICDLQISLTYEMRSPACLNSIRTSRFSPDSEFIAAAGDDQKVFLWDAKNLEFIKILQIHKDSVTSVAFTPDSRFLASTCCAGDLIVYDMKDGKYSVTKDGAHDLGAMCCDFSPQVDQTGSEDSIKEYTLATCGNDSLIKIWKIKSNQILDCKELSTHGGNVVYIRFSSEVPNLLASCATDHTARLWNVNTCESLHVFDQHSSIVTTCTFSQDSTLLATGSLDKNVLIWNLPRKQNFEKTSFILETKKLIQNWSTDDIMEWLNLLGFTETSTKVQLTSLNGQHLLGLRMNEILDLMGIEGEERHAVKLNLYWLRNEAKRGSHSRFQNDAPHQFLCPITHEIMVDPVICSDGFTYERGAITEWLLCGKNTSPMTNEPLRDLKCLPNTALKMNILKFLYGEDVQD